MTCFQFDQIFIFFFFFALDIANPLQPHAASLILDSYTGEEIARANGVFERNLNSTDYVDSFGTAEQVAGVAPLESAPTELVVMGRSNCGKSTLLNAVLGRHLANTSQRPGYTRTANRFACAPFFTLIDVPGYGFAEVSHDHRKRWARMEQAFFADRTAIARFLILIDSRRGITDLDEERIERLEQFSRSYQLILTKADKLTPLELRNVIAKTEKRVRAKQQRVAVPAVIATSGLVNNYGVGILRAVLLEAAGHAATFRDAADIEKTAAHIRGLSERELNDKLQRPPNSTFSKQQIIDRHIPSDPLAIAEAERRLQLEQAQQG